MDQNTINQIRTFVSDNELEKALDLMIGFEESKGRERYNTLMLLKGKLDMLEEQEHANLLSFDELSQQKMKIAHSILKMTDDKGSPAIGGAAYKHVEINKTLEQGSSGSPVMKYLIMGALGVILALLVYNMVQPVDVPPSNEPSANKTEVVDNRKEDTADNKGQKEIPQTKEDNILLNSFPKEGRQYSLGDTKFALKNIQPRRLPKAGAAAPDKLEISFTLELYCRTNLDQCTRPSLVFLMDDQVIEPVEHSRTKDWIATGDTVEEQFKFVFNVDNPAVRIKLEKHNSPWIRGFRILM